MYVGLSVCLHACMYGCMDVQTPISTNVRMLCLLFLIFDHILSDYADMPILF